MAAIRSDAAISQAVLDALKADPRLRAANIGVDVDRGVVHLRGTVPNRYQKRLAVEDARQVTGVVEVVDELTVAAPAARSDQEIASDVLAALRRDPRVEADRIKVSVTNGVVFLSGTAASPAQKLAAAQDAWAIPGVVDVVDAIVVEPTVSPSDRVVSERVLAAIASDPRIEAWNIAADVDHGVVHLRGTVPSGDQKRLAEAAAERTPGVRRVVNELKVVGR